MVDKDSCEKGQSFIFQTMFLQANLTKQQNDFKITLKRLEDDLLARLSAASGNFLSDTALVESLENTKATGIHIIYRS